MVVGRKKGVARQQGGQKEEVVSGTNASAMASGEWGGLGLNLGMLR